MGRTASASTYSLVRVFTKLSTVSTLALRLTSSSPLAPYRHAEGRHGRVPTVRGESKRLYPIDPRHLTNEDC